MSNILNECKSLLSLFDLSKWNTNNDTDISFMLSKYSSLLSFPDISKWNTYKITNMKCIFEFSSWNTIGIINNKMHDLQILIIIVFV